MSGWNSAQGEAASSEMRVKRLPTPADAAFLFSFAIFLFLVFGTRVQNWRLLPGLGITEVGLILLPVLLFAAIRRLDFRQTFRLYPIRIPVLLCVLLVMFFAVPLSSMVNLAYIELLKLLFGKVILLDLPPATGWLSLLENLAAMALSAAVCEEMLFRGFIMKGLQRLGPKTGILLSALLFAFFHLDPSRFLGVLLLGLLIGWIVHQTGSLFAGMFAHFLNNAYAVVLLFVYRKNEPLLRTASPLDFSKLNGYERVVTFFTYGMYFIFCGLILFSMLFLLKKVTSHRPADPPVPRAKARGLLWLLPGLSVVCLVDTLILLTYSGRTMPWLRALIHILSGS